MAANNEARNFNIFLKSTESVAIPKCNLHDGQAEIKLKIDQDKIVINNIATDQAIAVKLWTFHCQIGVAT